MFVSICEIINGVMNLFKYLKRLNTVVLQGRIA